MIGVVADRCVVAHAADPRLDDFRDLAIADRRPDRPGGRGLVIVEGVPVVQRLLASAYPVRAVMGVESRIEALEANLSTVDAPVYVVTAELMAEVVGFHLNRGVLAVAGRAPMPAVADLLAAAARVVVLEGVNDHENLGAVFRNVAGLGVDGVLLGDRCADPLYRRSVRVSMGHVLRVPFAVLDPWPDGLDLVRAAGFEVWALTPNESAVAMGSLAADEKIAVLLGAEGPGLTDAALMAADVLVRIPMADGVDSLNVATAAAIACYHVAGHR